MADKQLISHIIDEVLAGKGGSIFLPRMQQVRRYTNKGEFAVVFNELLMGWKVGEARVTAGELLSELDFTNKDKLVEKVAEIVIDWVGNRTGLGLVSANFSLELVGMVNEKIQKYGLENRLMVEILEDMKVDSFLSSHIQEDLGKLKRRGVKLLLDDFGSGNTGFAEKYGDAGNWLNKFMALPPGWDFVKIDLPSLKAAFGDLTVILADVARISKQNGVGIVVEKVETEVEFEMLSKFDLNLIQGYYNGGESKFVDDD